jgi:tetratricopeptide (TPR) repeat protein
MLGIMLCGAMAQAPEDPQFDPSDVYFQAYLEVRAAEQLEKDGDFMAAMKKYDQAGKLFDSVGRFYPDWKAGMVQNRRELTSKALDEVRGKAGEQVRKREGVIAELEGGAKVGAKPLPDMNPARKPDLEIAVNPDKAMPETEVKPPVEILPKKPVDPLQAQKLKDAEAELSRLKKMIAETDSRSNAAMRNASRVDDLAKQNEILARQLRAAESNVDLMKKQVVEAKAQAAEAPGIDPLQAQRLEDAEAELSRLRKMIANADARSNAAMRNASRVDDLTKQNDLLARQLKAAETNVNLMRKQVAEARGNASEPQGKSILEVDPLEARRLKDAEAELARLRKMIADADTRSNAAMRNASRVDDLTKQNGLLARQLKAAETNVQSLRARMAAAPVQSEMNALNKQIERLEQEREAMGMALKASRGDHTEALSKIEILTADIQVMKNQVKDLRQAEANTKRDLATERKVANEVVAGQRKQMEALEKALEGKSQELEQAQVQIASLTEELQQSREAFDALREERDGLLQERDQMAELLKQDDAGRTVKLIEQNMGLAKLLREANEKVERLNLDNNATKDDVVDALRDLAIAKSQINRLHQEKREQDKRIGELLAKLRDEEKALASGQVEADPAEVEMLREVIRRQLRVQERRSQAKELLVEAAKDLGKQDEKLNEAIGLFDGAEMVLTPEEQKLVADQQVDGEFVSPFARDRASVNRATSDLNRELDSYDRAATKAYLAGRLLPTRELFEMMVEQHPGHVPALCKLGVVQMKLDQPDEAAESFQKAIELDGNNAYANRMLGYAFMKIGDLPSAETHVKRAVELAPDDAKAYLLLGTISYRLGETVDAESNFKSAIGVDPVPSEPYFNLALICAKNGRREDGRDYYAKALERGAVPDQLLETRLEGKP